MSLAANFGELRPNHYHMGLDIRTQRRENLPVFAAADGYVARVSIEPGGFGQAIYIRHPNGYTTVYGHLNKFFPALAAYVAEQQYKLESWRVSLDVPLALFPVRKGDLIAYSGSTGGSQGPHLHFEIRRTDGDINLNPLLFGLPVPDNTDPVILRLAYYDSDQGLYDQSPHILPVRKGTAPAIRIPSSHHPTAFSVTPALLTVPFPRISFGISAFDTQTGSANPNGIFESVLFEDDQPLIGFQMDNISYDNTRNINAHIDYKTRLTGGPFLQLLSFLPGYPFPSIYRTTSGASNSANPASTANTANTANAANPANSANTANTVNAAVPAMIDPASDPASKSSAPGTLDLSDGLPHRIRIEVKDANGNASAISFRAQYRSASPAVSAPPSPAVSAPASPTLSPVSGKKFYPSMIDGLETPNCAFYLGERSLYDSVFIDATVVGYPGSGHTLPGGVSPTYQIGQTWIPLLEPVLVRLLNTRALHVLRVDSFPGSTETSPTASIVMVCFHGQDKDVQLPEWRDGWASARFRTFGNFQLVEDTIPPSITPLTPIDGSDLGKADRIAFMVKDNLDVIRHFRAELDGKWLCFTNDKGLAYIYRFDDRCPAGAHILKVSAEDVAGNKTEKEYHFTR